VKAAEFKHGKSVEQVQGSLYRLKV